MHPRRTRIHFRNEDIKRIKPTGKWESFSDDEVVGLQLRMAPSGTKVFQVRGYLNGRRKTITLGPASALTVKQARDAARDKLSAMKVRGEDPIEVKRQARREAVTIRDFLDGDYWDEVLSHKKAGANTRQRIASGFESFLDRRLSDMTLGNAIVTWRSKRKNSGVTESTLNKDTNALRALFNEAVRRGLIEENPLRSMKQFKDTGKRIVRYLSHEEEKRLRDALAARDTKGREGRARYNQWADERRYPRKPAIPDDGFVDHLTPMVLLSMNTGLRRGELFGLTWDDVDFAHGVLTVRAETTKDGGERHIALSDEALDVLRRWGSQKGTDGLVFPGKDGRLDNVKKAWQGVLEDAEIRNFRWHDLRHHFASRLVQNGVRLEIIKELLGHSDFKLTARYSHLGPNALSEAVRTLNQAGNILQFPANSHAANGHE